MKTFVVFGSHGQVSANTETGDVVSYVPVEGDPEPGYGDIVRFDVVEWFSKYPGEKLDSVDILDIGYWYCAEAVNDYEPPVEEHRQTIAEMGGCFVGNKALGTLFTAPDETYRNSLAVLD